MCAHTEAEAAAKEAEANAKEIEKNSFETLLKQLTQMKQQTQDYAGMLDCVINNLEGNTTQAGKTFDEGRMTEYYEDSQKVIKECEEREQECQKNITQLTAEIENLRNQAKALRGTDCGPCRAAAEAAASSSKVRV